MSANSAGEFPIKIYLLTQNRLLREVVVRLFQKRRGVTLVGVSHEGAEALDELAVTLCDILLLDSLKTLRAVRQRAETAECLRKIKVLLFGMEMDSDSFFQALRMGACGYLLNDASSTEIVEAVRGIAQGEAICSPRLCKSLFEYVSNKTLLHSGKVERRGRPANDLIRRKRKVMPPVATGTTNKETTASLQVAEFTVNNRHRSQAISRRISVTQRRV